MNAAAESRSRVDVAVVGGGAAGLSAALFLARAQRRVVVFDAGSPRIGAVTHIHELLGSENATPDEFLAHARRDTTRYGTEIRDQPVVSVEPRHDGQFDLHTVDTSTTASAVVLATGLVDVLPDIPGLSDIWGRDLHVCPCFSGHEVRNERIVVMGIGAQLAQSAKFLTAWTPNVTVITRFRFDRATSSRLHRLDVAVLDDDVTAFEVADQRLVAARTCTGRRVEADAVFISTPMRARSNLAATLCEVTTDGFAVTDINGSTSRRGLWAIGNARDPIGHLAHALADGARVGPWVNDFLIDITLDPTS
jgi:thioredoxin reductase